MIRFEILNLSIVSYLLKGNRYKNNYKETDAATVGVLYKKVLLKFLQISQENACAGVPLQLICRPEGLPPY